MRNQKGYALLLVLGAVVIIGLLVPPLAYQIISSSSQASQTEQNVQLDNMYDMGKQMGRRHVEAAVDGEIEYGGFDKIVDETDGQVTWEHVVNHLTTELEVGTGNDPYKIDNLDFHTYEGEVDVLFTRVEEVNDRLEIEYEVTPVINADSSDSVTETFYLGRIGGDGSDGGPGDWFDEEDGTIEDDMFGDESSLVMSNNENLNSQWDQVNDQEKYSNSIFKGNRVTLPGTGEYHIIGPIAFNMDSGLYTPGSSSSIQIKNSLFISNTEFSITQDTTILVEEGHAHFHDVAFDFQHNRSPKMCIDGDIYDYGSNTIQIRNNNDPLVAEFHPTNSCDFATLDRHKIYYTGELKSGEPQPGDYITDLILEGTRGE